MAFFKTVRSMRGEQKAYIFLVALFSINFLGYGSLIAVAGCILLLVFGKSIKMPSSGLFLWFYLLSIAYPSCAIIFGEITNMTISLWLIGFGVVSSYLLGTMASRLFPESSPSSFIILVSFCFAAHGLLNCVITLLSGTGGSGQCMDFWTKSYSAATAQAILFTPLVSIAWAILVARRKKALKVAALLLIVAALYYDFMLGGRSFFILLALSGLLLLAIKLCNVSNSVFGAIKSVLFIGALCFVAFALYQADFLSIKSSFETSYMAHRFSYQGVGDDDRAQRWLYYIEHLPEGVFGGNVIGSSSGYGYAHNLWLDTYDEAGLLPLLLLLLITVQSAAKTIRVASRSNGFEQSVYLSFFIILMVQFFIEPVMQGSPLLFMAFSYFCGLIDQQLTRFSGMATGLENHEH